MKRERLETTRYAGGAFRPEIVNNTSQKYPVFFRLLSAWTDMMQASKESNTGGRYGAGSISKN
jgi:hypothetical protein